jgi:hypothetical protein
MSQVILYRQDDGRVSVIYPVSTTSINPDTGQVYTIDEIAQRSVPTGKPYKIVDESTISSDRSFRNAWTVDEADLTDGVGS